MKNDYVINDKVNLHIFNFFGANTSEQKELLWQQLNKLLQKHYKLKILKDKSLQLSISVRRNYKGIMLKIEEKLVFVKYNKIIRAEASSNYTFFYTTLCNKPVVTSKTLKFYTPDLLKNNFVKTHRAHLVNTAFIKNYCSNTNEVELTNGSYIKVARRRKNTLSKFLK